MKKCECCERTGTKVYTIEMFNETKKFFEDYVKKGLFTELPVDKPFYIGTGISGTSEWYADKWYKCNCCGTLWEFKYPDFPICGKVRKFPDGVYKPE